MTEQDAYDFFTGVWEEEKEQSPEEKKPKKKVPLTKKEASTSRGSEEDSEEEGESEDDEYETADEGGEDADGDKAKLLPASDYIGKQYDWEVTEWRGPEVLGQQERETQEVSRGHLVPTHNLRTV